MKKWLAIIAALALIFSCCAHAEELQAVVEAQYPEQAPYPDEELSFSEDEDARLAYDEAWDNWYEDSVARTKAGQNCAEGMEPFFTSVLRTYLSGTNENLVLSPVNIWMAFSILAEVTEGETRQEFLDALGCENVEQLREKAEKLFRGNYVDDTATACRMAASAWLSDALPYNEETLRTLAESYYASSWTGEMGSETLNTALQKWLSEQTGGLLDDAVADIKTDPETLLALCTTIYFRTRWADEFSKSATMAMPFHALDGDEEADFLRRSGVDTVWYGDGFSAVSLPMLTFGSMWIILPDEGLAPDDLLGRDDAVKFLLRPGEQATGRVAMVNLAVPKFDVSSNLDLADGMPALGINKAFDAKQSDYTAIAPDSEGIFLSSVAHAARVKIDEEGCEAAAFTVALACGAALPPDEVIEFTADRPFVFVITGADDAPLFVGVVQHP